MGLGDSDAAIVAEIEEAPLEARGDFMLSLITLERVHLQMLMWQGSKCQRPLPVAVWVEGGRYGLMMLTMLADDRNAKLLFYEHEINACLFTFLFLVTVSFHR